MGRGATKAADNVWYQARKEAAKWNNKLSSRAGAAEELNISEDAVKDVELSLNKCMPVDTAVRMAKLYKAPNLLNHYCLCECPIGCYQSISDALLSIDRVTVKLLYIMRVDKIGEMKDTLLGIAEDGVIGEDDKQDMKKVVEHLDSISKTISELKTAAMISLGDDWNGW